MRDPVNSTAVRPASRADADPRQDLAHCLEQGRAGDSRSIDKIVSTLTPLLWQVARAQGLHAEDAEDVVQTIWLRFLRHIDGIRSPQALTAWLVTATRREAWRTAAASRRRPALAAEALALEVLPDSAPGPEQLVGDHDWHRRLWAKLLQLPPRCRELLRLIAFGDRPDYQAISQALGMPVGSIGPTRGRCLAKLRALLTSDPSWSHP